MNIQKFNNNGKEYLRLCESYSVMREGRRVNTNRVIKNIGPLSRFDDGKKDYLKRLRKSFKDGVPFIKELEAFTVFNEKNRVSILFDRSNGEICTANPKNIGYLFLEGVFNFLGISDVLAKYKSDSKIGYDLTGLTKLLTFGRVLEPCSKLRTFEEQRDKYLFNVCKKGELKSMYRSLDALNLLSEKIQLRMNTKIRSSNIGRNTSVCFYDVTNYWFEIDEKDEDVLGIDGEVIEGLRKPGPSKAKNNKPIVQMGLFMDDKGIPISYKLFHGNHIDQTTLRPTLKKTINKMDFGKVIIVADGGCNSGQNLSKIVKSKNGYIVSKSTKASNKETKEWILDDTGYIWNDKKTFKLKSKIRTRKVKTEDDKMVILKEKIVSYWSKKHYDYEVRQNQNFIEYLESVIDNPDKLKDKQSKVQKYLKKTHIDKQTGEIINPKVVLSLMIEKIKKDMNLLGYYTIMTSELALDEHEIIDKYKGLSRIEDNFRIIKSNLDGRPVFLKKKEHVNAHFLICFIALSIIRILQSLKNMKTPDIVKNKKRKWTQGILPEKLITSLNSFTATRLPGDYYMLTEYDDTIKTLLDLLNTNPLKPLPNLSEIKQLKLNISKRFLYV